MGLSAVLCAASIAAPPPPQPAAQGVGTPGVGAPGVGTPGVGMPDDDFIEFLGADDVGDAALWAFLKKSAPRKDPAPISPPQDAKQ